MREGQLVDIKTDTKLQGDGPYIILRGPYEYSRTLEVAGNKITEITTCVDLLSSSGDIFEAIKCKTLERIR